MKTTKRSEPTRTVPDATQREEEIRQHAYELYESRGREDGHDFADWLQAEAEILGNKKRPIGTQRRAAV